jgi:hypothetical protein
MPPSTVTTLPLIQPAQGLEKQRHWRILDRSGRPCGKSRAFRAIGPRRRGLLRLNPLLAFQALGGNLAGAHADDAGAVVEALGAKRLGKRDQAGVAMLPLM